jgi:Formyl transferase
LRTVLICHHDEPLTAHGLARWLASFTDLAGLVVIHETKQRFWRRIRREIRRVGILRFFDVLAFRLYYRLKLKKPDLRWEQAKLAELCSRFPPLPASTKILDVAGANLPEVQSFVRKIAPDLMLARCKTILKEQLFTIPKQGTFVMHPGICPEYRNAHGCFWALAQNDLDRVGMTLLRIDKGVDTGPVYGYYHANYDELVDSPLVIQHRVVFDNLDTLREKMLEIGRGEARPLDMAGRASGEWGQPWLTAYWRWRRQAARRAKA